MKKIFTLISMALVAMSANAQTPEVWDASSLKDPEAMKSDGDTHDWSVVKADAIVKEVNTAKNVVIHDPDDVLPWPGKHQATDEEGNLLWNIIKDDDGNEIGREEIWVKHETDPATVTSNATSQLYNFTITATTASVTMKAIGTPNLGETESWQFGKATNPEEPSGNQILNVEGCDPVFIDFIKVKSGNCTEQYYDWREYNEDGDVVHRVASDTWDPNCGVKPAMGSWYEFTADKAGELKIGFFVNKRLQDNKLYFAELQDDGLHYTLLDPAKLTVWGWTSNNTYPEDNENCIRNTHPRADYCVVEATNLQNPFLGYISFAAEAAKTYLFLSPVTQLGCYGFQFTPDGSAGISNVKADGLNEQAPVYNLAGQQVEKGYKGIVIQNGRKVVNK